MKSAALRKSVEPAPRTIVCPTCREEFAPVGYPPGLVGTVPYHLREVHEVERQCPGSYQLAAVPR